MAVTNKKVVYSMSNTNPNLIECPDCKNKVSFQARSCPFCGCPVNEKLTNFKGRLFICFIIVIIIAFVSYFVYQYFEEQNIFTKLKQFIIKDFHNRLDKISKGLVEIRTIDDMEKRKVALAEILFDLFSTPLTSRLYQGKFEKIVVNVKGIEF